MFDIGFWELVLVAVVGLLILGPERLPGAIRTGSLWLNRLRRSFAEIKQDIEREVGVDELKRDLHNERIMESLRETRQQLAGDLDETRRQLNQLHQPVTSEPAPRQAQPQPPAAGQSNPNPNPNPNNSMESRPADGVPRS